MCIRDRSMLTDGIADPEGVTMAFITLSMVEIFHSFNMRSRRASIFSMKTQNKWLWGAAALAVVLTAVSYTHLPWRPPELSALSVWRRQVVGLR